MNAQQLTALFTKHEGRISKLEQGQNDLKEAYTKHINRHFQLTCIAVTQLIVLIVGLLAVFIKFSG